MQQRDSFISVIHAQAERDKDVMFLTADFGAPALDAFRAALPYQVIHCGISEQNMIDLAVGLALSGKRVYTYAMSPFYLRAAEQLKLAAIHGVPITVVSVGAGLSYAGSGPTHYATEDIAVYRTLVNCDLYTVSTANMAAVLAAQEPKRMRVIRLERGWLPELYPHFSYLAGFVGNTQHLACGYLVHWLKARGTDVTDVYQQKPIPDSLVQNLRTYDSVYTYEEQYREGGFGAAIIEALSDYHDRPRIFRRALPSRAIYENGTRDQLLEALL
jgi:transketolase